MFENPLVYAFLIICLVVFLVKRIRIANEGERFAINTVGKFRGLKGQGLHFKWSGGETEWTRLAADDRGKIVTDKLLRVQNVDVPFHSIERLKIGDYVRISGFENDIVLVNLDRDQRTSFICEKCGHENKIN